MAVSPAPLSDVAVAKDDDDHMYCAVSWNNWRVTLTIKIIVLIHLFFVMFHAGNTNICYTKDFLLIYIHISFVHSNPIKLKRF